MAGFFIQKSMRALKPASCFSLLGHVEVQGKARLADFSDAKADGERLSGTQNVQILRRGRPDWEGPLGIVEPLGPLVSQMNHEIFVAGVKKLKSRTKKHPTRGVGLVEPKLVFPLKSGLGFHK